MLQTPWQQRRNQYDIVIIGSGYGGAITAARLATAPITPTRSICILERGKERQPGDYPEQPFDVAGQIWSALNPLGLYELLNYQDISVIKGSGLGGTSLINANVAIVPDREVFEQSQWPREVTFDALAPFYQLAAGVLAAAPHPRALDLAKVKALDRRARQLGTSAQPLNIVVNFSIDGANAQGVRQKPCVNCGNCVTGCNVGAKNTLYMNYLPMARNAGAIIHTQTKVEWLEKKAGGGWKIHGKHVDGPGNEQAFTLDAGEVILSAGSLNSTEILLRSEMHGLSVSPALGTRFSGNGDFFGLAYNCAVETDVLGYPYQDTPPPGASPEPGPNIVGIVRYEGSLPEAQRISVEDFSFPLASIAAAKGIFAGIRGEDTVAGNESVQLQRLMRDLDPTNRLQDPDGALNHTMLYLVMGQDDARGTILFETPWTDPEGRIRVSWDNAGQQQIFTRMNGELRRHARALEGSFISNPTWSFFNLHHLITAHPLGGCPMGDDHLQGAVDIYGRVFQADGGVHQGLFVIDGSVVPSALGVNPFLTISALTESFAARKIRQLRGDEYPAPGPPVSMAQMEALDVITCNEGQLEALFRRCPTMGIDALINEGGDPAIDVTRQIIRNDRYWKGFFPQGNVLNAMSSAIFTGFKKEFHKQDGKYTGITSDTDDRIHARNSLEEVEVKHNDGGTLEPGRYILLRYVDPPWQGFYDIFKIINQDLMIGRVYLGAYPHGTRVFTFPMSRRYGFEQMTVTDHALLYDQGVTPAASDLEGIWRMDIISNANHAAAIAYLQFLNEPGGFKASYQLMGVMEGLVVPTLLQDHFQLNDFTLFHDEIRRVSADFLVGKYVTPLPPGLGSLLGNTSFGMFHTETDGRFGFYYILTRAASRELPTNTLLRPFLDVRLPDGVGMTFDEVMDGWYFPGQGTPVAGRDGDLTIGARIPSSGNPPEAVAAGFNARITIRDVNEFVEGYEHEARIKGSIHFTRFENLGDATFVIDEPNSRFHYLRINPVTREAEMAYHIEFVSPDGRRFLFNGTKYMQKDGKSGSKAVAELLQDYTTLYCHVAERLADGGSRETGTAWLKFRTFENLQAAANLAGFLASFQITGTSDPVVQFQARMRFIAFTAQFVQREYDPLGFGASQLATDVRAEVRRGAEEPDYFSTRATTDLQAILRDTSTRDLGQLINTGMKRFDFANQRIFRDSFWKGSFAKDSLLGWEERVRNRVLGDGAASLGGTFAGGSFWKRFDRMQDGVVSGYVVNYQMTALPGLPEVRIVSYPNDRRPYFKKGDPILLLSYTNDPYKMVYDTIKVIDDQNAIGVMHLGAFPDGFEFATFVMARNNYPFVNMSIEDHGILFADPHATAPSPGQLEGVWEGRVIFVTATETSLLNQFSPVLFQASFQASGPQLKAQYKVGPVALDDPSLRTDLRAIDSNTLIGRCAVTAANSVLSAVLAGCLQNQGAGPGFCFILKRT